jgi:4-hydroxybenzoyl-CoA reductase subunit alpha
MIAEDLGLDPLAMALKNGLRTGDESAAGFKIVSSGFSQCLEKVAARSKWRHKRNTQKTDADTVYGIGLGCGGFPSGAGFYFNKTTSAHSTVIIKAGAGGGIHVFTGASDIGQGSDSVICQIVAEVLGLPMDDIYLTSADTHLTPPDMGTYSSRVTVAAGNAALKAANLIKAQIFTLVSDELEANSEDLIAFDRKIAVNGSPDRFITFADAVNLHQKINNGAPLVAQGSYNSPDPLSPTYSFGAYICEVAVSRLTGEVRIKKFSVAHDCGQPLNPMSVEGQVEGCIGMGLGYAISEQLIFEDGRTLNPSFLGYGVPTADQMPEIDISHVITDDPHGPFGAKETGEGSLDPAAPAIANAVYNATGVRIKDLPITAAKILEGLARLS